MPLLPRTGLEIAPVCLGGNVFGWTSDWDESYAVLDAFLDGGGNAIDTADAYSQWVPGNLGGESETIIGGWMQSRRSRDRVVIATKVGRHSLRPNLRRETILAGVDGALRRLRTDRIDLLYAHSDDPGTPLEETMSAFAEVIAQGKVLHIAASNYSPERLRQAQQVARDLGVPGFVALQPHYSLMVRQDYEGELARACQEEGLACLPYYSLASGFLTGKYPDAESITGAARGGRLADYANPRGFAILDVVRRIAADHGVQPATVALAWLLAKPTVIAPIASASRPGQVPALTAAASLTLSPADIADLDEVSS